MYLSSGKGKELARTHANPIWVNSPPLYSHTLILANPKSNLKFMQLKVGTELTNNSELRETEDFCNDWLFVVSGSRKKSSNWVDCESFDSNTGYTKSEIRVYCWLLRQYIIRGDSLGRSELETKFITSQHPLAICSNGQNAHPLTDSCWLLEGISGSTTNTPILY